MALTSSQEMTLTKISEPIMASVIILNDDYTPMDFVINILMSVFEKNQDQATQIMLEVHHKGSGVCGIYPYDIAELKLQIAREKTKTAQLPLQLELQIL
ncbi:ATP-dependent Clp protease adaptor ClpS [Helicobacter mustelae]|nr:ATP-dependent Clp protease adaptor ClpS [Helicobacter mustelae]SQH72066.1 ATP-dependent Clp protease adapter protein ClpS [Helicobacter mustelae]STP13209.1 ATP-dependent Clp protease adapter protein ClpS [Helicobacter mustelae]